jgi:hypothetical protein
MNEFTFLKDKVVLVTGVSTTDERYKSIGQALAELVLKLLLYQEIKKNVKKQ